MRFLMTTLFVTFFIFSVVSFGYAQPCGQITSWPEEDISTFFGINPESLINDGSSFTNYVISNSQSPASCSPGNQNTIFDIKYVWQASDWNISARINSFGDDIAAGICFVNRLPTSVGHATYEVLEQGANYILYYIDAYQDTDNQEMFG